MRARLARHLLFLSLPAVASSASAGDTYWTAATGDWVEPNNWSAGLPSPTFDSAIINNGGTAIVTSLAESHIVEIGSGGAGAVFIENGGKLTAYLDLELGRGAGDVGEISVDGANSAFSAPTRGNDSFFVFVGYDGVGNITVTNGGSFFVAAPVEVAARPGSFANLMINGAGSNWRTTSEIGIGAHGSVLLTVQNGSTLTTSDATVSRSNDGHATLSIDGAGSRWDADSLTLGRDGDATLNLRHDGIVSLAGGDGSAVVAARAGSTGTINFGGAFGQPETPSGSLEAAAITGGEGTALINFNRPGTTIFATPLQGTLSIAKLGTASTLFLDGVHTYTGRTDAAEGTLVVKGLLGATRTTVQFGAHLEGTGTIGGPIVLQATATLSPGVDGPGILTAGGFEWIGGGKVLCQLGSSDADSDALALTGAFVKQGTGTYNFDFSDGATPPTTRTYTLVTFPSSIGFSASDFGFTYSGSRSGLNGTFELTPTALLFHVSGLPVQLQSFDVE